MTEDQIRASVHMLCAQGLYAEPTSAIAAAAFPGFISRGLAHSNETNVMVLSGSGLKAATTMADFLTR